jgi:hypothetical protein
MGRFLREYAEFKSNLDSSQFGLRANLVASQFESGLDSGPRENRMIKRGRAAGNRENADLIPVNFQGRENVIALKSELDSQAIQFSVNFAGGRKREKNEYKSRCTCHSDFAHRECSDPGQENSTASLLVANPCHIERGRNSGRIVRTHFRVQQFGCPRNFVEGRPIRRYGSGCLG